MDSVPEEYKWRSKAKGEHKGRGEKDQALSPVSAEESRVNLRGSSLLSDVDALEEGLLDGSISSPRMIYVVPTHQNPTGHTMPLEDRWKLCQLARKYSILVAADEVYHLLDWRQSNIDGKRPARFSVLDELVADNMSSAGGTSH